MASSVLEVQSIGHLELALSYIFRLKEDKELHHVSNAEAICITIENSNSTASRVSPLAGTTCTLSRAVYL